MVDLPERRTKAPLEDGTGASTLNNTPDVPISPLGDEHECASDSIPTISSAIRGILGQQLRAMYDGLRAEPLLKRFVDLIARLHAADPKDDR